MKIALIGADGQLGSDLMKTLKSDQLLPLYYPEFDVTKPEKVRETLSEFQPELVINTSAYHRVDECEDNPKDSFLVNSIAVRDLVLICREFDFDFLHFSTDYVFDGQKKSPYTEEDSPNPLSVYACSKLAGEYFVRNILKNYYLVRTCGLYGVAGCWGKGTNFVDVMIALEKKGKPLRIVNDQWVTPTSTAELASRIGELIRTGRYGLYHLTNEGWCTWFEFAQNIFALMGKEPKILAVDTKSYGAKALRPSYSVLENKSAREIGLTDFSPWKVALKDYLIMKGDIK
jgi:dTDP-4-dehydrorhamnose reductase